MRVGEAFFPSLVAFKEGATIAVGARARPQQKSNPAETVDQSKSFIGLRCKPYDAKSTRGASSACPSDPITDQTGAVSGFDFTYPVTRSLQGGYLLANKSAGHRS